MQKGVFEGGKMLIFTKADNFYSFQGGTICELCRARTDIFILKIESPRYI